MAALGFNDRNYERKAIVLAATMALGEGVAPRDCIILDISDGGARLDVGPLPVPETFTLLLSANGNVRRACVLRWRKEHQIGVEFA
jgi:hypothetical protein